MQRLPKRSCIRLYGQHANYAHIINVVLHMSMQTRSYSPAWGANAQPGMHRAKSPYAQLLFSEGKAAATTRTQLSTVHGKLAAACCEGVLSDSTNGNGSPDGKGTGRRDWNQSPSGKCRTIFLSHQLAADALAATRRSTAQKTPGRTKAIPPSMEMSVSPNRTTPTVWRATTQTMAKPTRMRNETNRARRPQPTDAATA